MEEEQIFEASQQSSLYQGYLHPWGFFCNFQYVQGKFNYLTKINKPS